MGKNKRKIKLGLKKPLPTLFGKIDSTIILNNQEIISDFVDVHPDNVENVEMDPSLINHIKNIRNVDERSLSWNGSDVMDLKANLRLHYCTNINRAIKSMRDSPFAKYLHDQICDLNNISKASISGVTMISDAQESVYSDRNLFNVGGDVLAVKSNDGINKTKSPKTGILSSWGNTDKTDIHLDQSDQTDQTDQQHSDCKDNIIKTMKTREENSCVSDEYKQMIEEEGCIIKKNEKHDLKLPHSADATVNKSNAVPDNISTEINDSDSKLNVPENKDSEHTSSVVSSIQTLANVNKGSQRGRKRPLNVTESANVIDRSSTVEDRAIDAKRRRIVRPSQFNDYFVDDISINAILKHRNKYSTNTSANSSLASDSKTKGKTRKRSTSIETYTSPIKTSNNKNQERKESTRIIATLDQEVLDTKSDLNDTKQFKCAEKVSIRKNSIYNKENNANKTACNDYVYVGDSKPGIEVTKSPVKDKEQPIESMMTAARLDKASTKVQQQLTDSCKSVDKNRVNQGENLAKKQKLVEWETLVQKQKTIRGQIGLNTSQISQEAKVKRKRRRKVQQVVVDTNKVVALEKSVSKDLKTDDCKTLDKYSVDISFLREENTRDREKCVNNGDRTTEGAVVTESNFGEKNNVAVEKDIEAVVVESDGIIADNVVVGDCSAKVNSEIQIPKLVLRKGRKKMCNTDIDAEEVISKKESVRRLKQASEEMLVSRPIGTCSSGPRVKHVSRSDIINLDVTRKKCMIKSLNRFSSFKTDKSDDNEAEDSRDASLFEKSGLDRLPLLVQCNNCGSCDSCTPIKEGDGKISTRHDKVKMCITNKCDEGNERRDFNCSETAKDDQNERSPISSSVTNDQVFGKLIKRGIESKGRGSDIDVYRDSDKDDNSSDEDNKNNEQIDADTDNVRILEEDNITLQLAHDGGYPIVSSRRAMSAKVLCYSCGSGGDQMIHCVSCAEPFHFFCIEFQFRPKSKEMFVCRNCTKCHLCLKYGSDLKCIKCQLGFHPVCVDRYPPSQSVDRSKWVCYKCAMCLHCGTKACEAMDNIEEKKNNKIDWSMDPWQCGPCLQARNEGRDCPACGRAYVTEMDSVKCDKCKRSVHRQCVGLTEDEYEIRNKKEEHEVPGFVCNKCNETSRSCPPSVTRQDNKTPLKVFCNNEVTRLKSQFVALSESKEQQLLSSASQQSNERGSKLLTMLDQMDGVNDSFEDEEEEEEEEMECQYGRRDGVTNCKKYDVEEEMEYCHGDILMATDESCGTLYNSSDSVDGFDIDHVTMVDEPMDIVSGLPVDIDREDTTPRTIQPRTATVSLLSALRPENYLTIRHLIMDCLARVLVKLASSAAATGVCAVYESLIVFMKQLCRAMMPWIEFDLCMTTVQEIVRQYCARIGHVRTCIDTIVRNAIHKESRVFTSMVSEVEERLMESVVRGRQEFVIYHSELHLAALVKRLEEGDVGNAWSEYKRADWRGDRGGEMKEDRGLMDGEEEEVGIRERDRRQCTLCNEAGDDGVEGRLIYGGDDVWVHVQCALWSAEVYEKEDGALVHVWRAIRRGRGHRCDGCEQRGATVTCANNGCDRCYHFKCALDLETDPILSLPGTFFCSSAHAAAAIAAPMHPRIALADLLVLRRIYIPSVRTRRTLPTEDIVVSIGSLRIDNLGTLGLHSDWTKDHLSPVTFRARRLFWSTTMPHNLAMYSMRVVEDVSRKCAPTISQKHVSELSSVNQSAALFPGPPSRCYASLQSRTRTPSLSVTSHNNIVSHRLLPVRPSRIVKHRYTQRNPLFRLQSSIINGLSCHRHNNNLLPSSRPSLVINCHHQVDGQTDDICIGANDRSDISRHIAHSNHGPLSYQIDGFISHQSPKRAWIALTRQLSRLRSQQRFRAYPIRNDDGWTKFGLNHRAVVYLIEQMIGSDQCRNYRFKYHGSEIESREPRQRSDATTVATRHHPDSSRCLPWTRSNRVLDSLSLLSSHSNIAPSGHRPDRPDSSDNKSGSVHSDPCTEGLDSVHSLQSVHNGARARHTDVSVCLSVIEGRGLFAGRPFSANEFVMEYVGEAVRPIISQLRQDRRDRDGTRSYMFCLDARLAVIDATRRGNAARFLNHSCQPNCSSEIIQYRHSRHIVIITKRRVCKGEELTFDYRFVAEDSDRIRCNCGSAACRQYLN